MSDFSPYERVNADAGSPFLILCDHASNAIPTDVGGGCLGLPQAEMERHIAFDVGARGVTLELARMLAAPAILGRFSRLVIDPNRGADDPTLVMRLYDGTIIPANRNVDDAEVTRRLVAYFEPYHNAITAQIDGMIAAGVTPHLVSIHSYTPQLKGKPLRPWHVGVLWDKDGRMAVPLIRALEAEGDLCVGDNEPYSGELRGDCMYTHGTLRGLPHVLIELRHDLIRDEAGQKHWAARLAPMLSEIILTEDRMEKSHGCKDNDRTGGRSLSRAQGASEKTQ